MLFRSNGREVHDDIINGREVMTSELVEMRWIAPRHNTAMHRRMPGLHPATHHRREARGTVMSMLHGVTALGEPSQHVEKALCSHDAVDYLTQEVGMAVVTGVFFNHMHQHPTHRRASRTRFIAP